MTPLSDLPGLWDDGSLSSDEAMALLKCGSTKLYALLRTRTLPSEKIGKGYTIPRKAVVEYLARRRSRPVQATVPATP